MGAIHDPNPRGDYLIAHILDLVPYNQRQAEIQARGLARLHDEYVKAWQQRMRAALRQSPVYRPHVR